jgi:hypothetical protein
MATRLEDVTFTLAKVSANLLTELASLLVMLEDVFGPEIKNSYEDLFIRLSGYYQGATVAAVEDHGIDPQREDFGR